MSIEQRESIRERLRKNYLTNVWLINMLEKEGMYVTSSTLSSILSGSRRGKTVDRILDAADRILARYESKNCLDEG
jgi:hypothetical protein